MFNANDTCVMHWALKLHDALLLFYDDIMCFPNFFSMGAAWPVEVNRILDEPVPPETLMVAFADVPAAMPALVLIIKDAFPLAAAFADACAMKMKAAIAGTKF